MEGKRVSYTGRIWDLEKDGSFGRTTALGNKLECHNDTLGVESAQSASPKPECVWSMDRTERTPAAVKETPRR